MMRRSNDITPESRAARVIRHEWTVEVQTELPRSIGPKVPRLRMVSFQPHVVSHKNIVNNNTTRYLRDDATFFTPVSGYAERFAITHFKLSRTNTNLHKRTAPTNKLARQVCTRTTACPETHLALAACCRPRPPPLPLPHIYLTASYFRV